MLGRWRPGPPYVSKVLEALPGAPSRAQAHPHAGLGIIRASILRQGFTAGTLRRARYAPPARQG